MDEKKILLVDDEPDLVDIVSYELRAEGYIVAKARNGKDAMLQIKVGLPDMIILDINMPEMDGVDFFAKLKGNKATQKIPILIFTASGNLEQHFKTLKVEGFISKPFKMEEVLEKVKTILANAPAS